MGCKAVWAGPRAGLQRGRITRSILAERGVAAGQGCNAALLHPCVAGCVVDLVGSSPDGGAVVQGGKTGEPRRPGRAARAAKGVVPGGNVHLISGRGGNGGK